MKCKFCSTEIYPRSLDSIIATFDCNEHQPINVRFTVTSTDTMTVISSNKFKLINWNNQTLIQEVVSLFPYIQLIKKINYNLIINPNQFEEKIKTILTFS